MTGRAATSIDRDIRDSVMMRHVILAMHFGNPAPEALTALLLLQPRQKY